MKTARHPILRTPATLIEALAAACEIIVVLPANQIAVVADFLRRTLRPAIYARAVALCAHPGDVEGFRVVLEAGMPVHAVVTCPEEAIIFVDRQWGWLYPSARTVETPEAQVSAFLAERHGSFSLLTGMIAGDAAVPGCLRFTDRPHVYLGIRDPAMLAHCRPGTHVTVLASRSVWQSRVPCFVDVLAIWPAGTEPYRRQTDAEERTPPHARHEDPAGSLE